PLALDEYSANRRTGSFLLIDPADGTTLTAGMVGGSFGNAAPAAEPVTVPGEDASDGPHPQPPPARRP
ncbi:hypothetical protein AB0K43_22750, partial [Kitasatospora sp. NPDC049258]